MGGRRDALDERAQVGEGGVVGDGREAQRAREQGQGLQARDDGLQPPLLHAAQHHQPRQEEAHQQCLFEDERALVACIGLRVAQEHQKDAQKHHRVVCKQHHARQQRNVHSGHTHRHRALVSRFLPCLQRFCTGQVPAQGQRTCRGVHQHGQRGLPAKGGEHEGAVPAPGGGHHQHRGRGIRGERAADGHIDEQHAQRQVLEPLWHTCTEDLRGQHESGNGHGGGLGDERAQQRHSRQPQPGSCQRGGYGRQLGKGVDDGHHRAQHRARCGNDHDHEDEQRLGVVARFSVLQGLRAAHGQRHGHDEHHGPEAKDHLDFAQQVKQPGVAWVAVREPLEEFDGKGVQQRHAKKGSGNPLDEGCVHAGKRS